MALFRRKAESAQASTPQNAPGSGVKLSPSPAEPAERKVSEAMKNVNAYHREWTAKEIARGKHRGAVGGRWEEIGQVQLEVLKGRGLKPEHKLCDTGCGSLRGGVHFVRYLDAGNYFGLDINTSLIDAGRWELEQAGLEAKNANLLVSDCFEMSRFGAKFDFILAASLFTHLYANHIVRCLLEARKVLQSDGQFLATFFYAPSSGHLAPIEHLPGGNISHYDKDPFHYSIEEMTFMGSLAGLKTELIEGGKPGSQRGLIFRPV